MFLYSAFAAHRLHGPPGIADDRSSTGFTETEMLRQSKTRVEPTSSIKSPHTLSSVATSNALVPPLRVRTGSPSSNWTQRLILFSDFSTILGMAYDRRAGVLADMRRIYDGSLRKEFGTAANRQARAWEGRITFLVAATPDVDGAYSIFQSLGERFVMIRCHRADGTEAALAAMRQDMAEARRDLKNAVQYLLSGLPRIEPYLPDDIAEKIAALSELVVNARTRI